MMGAAGFAMLGVMFTTQELPHDGLVAPEPTGNIIEVSYDDIVALQRDCWIGVRGCAHWYGLELGDLCVIRYMRGAEVTRRHELRHCAEGAFHD